MFEQEHGEFEKRVHDGQSGRGKGARSGKCAYVVCRSDGRQECEEPDCVKAFCVRLNWSRQALHYIVENVETRENAMPKRFLTERPILLLGA